MSYKRNKSVSNLQETSKRHSLSLHNFQKSTVIPYIYDIENIRLIRSNQYPNPPVNKVYEMKKQKYQNKVKQILNNNPQNGRLALNNKGKTPQTTFETKIKRPFTAIIPISQYNPQPLISKDQLFIQFDQNLGELGKIIEQQQNYLREKVDTITSKVKKLQKNVVVKQTQEQKPIDVYLTSISIPQLGNKSRINCQHHKILSQLQQLVKKDSKKQRNFSLDSKNQQKQKKKSAINNFLTRSSTKKTIINQSANNNVRNEKIIKKSNNLLQLINKIQQTQKLSQKMIKSNLFKMQQQWYDNPISEKLQINQQTLQILERKRLKSDYMIKNDINILT